MRFSMYATLKFSRPIDAHNDYISPGGYEMISDDKLYQFDFENYRGKIDQDDKTLLHIECKYPDIDSFPDVADITPAILAQIEKFTEFFVYINSATKLTPIELVECNFVDHDRDEAEITLAAEVCKKTVFTTAGE